MCLVHVRCEVFVSLRLLVEGFDALPRVFPVCLSRVSTFPRVFPVCLSRVSFPCVKVAKESYESAMTKADEDVVQEKAKLEETKKEAEALVAQTKRAFGNIAAASTGSSQKAGDGLKSAATEVVPGAVLVPTLPGYILHGNDVSQEEYQQYMYTHPSLAGIAPDMVKAMAGVSMQWMQMKATSVSPAAPASAEPSPEGTVEGDPKQQDQADMDAEDPYTSDDEENERREANKKEEDIVGKAKIIRSAKVAKKAKGSKVAGVRSTIGGKPV